jgi:hypothetical protein
VFVAVHAGRGWRERGTPSDDGEVSLPGDAIVGLRRLRAGDQLDVGAQVRGVDLGDIVAFLAERTGDRPVAVYRDVRHRDAHAEILDIRDYPR